MVHRFRTAAVLLTAVVVVSMLMVTCREKQPGEIRMGVIVPLTGAAADFGKWAHNGVDLAITDLGQQPPEKGRSYKAVYEDHQMDTKLGLSAFKKLVDVDKVDGVITAGSGVVLAIAPEADRTHVLQMNYAAVSPAIRKAGPYTFTLVNDGDIETDEIARLAYQTLGIKQMAIVYANASYGVGTKDAMTRSFSHIGGQVIDSIAFPENFADIRAQLTRLKSLNPPAVYFIATIKDSGRLLKQAGELGVKTQWLTYNAFESPEVINIAGDAAEDVIYTSSNLFDLPNPGGKAEQFLQTYIMKYGERPNLYAATAYDAVQLLALAHASSDGTGEGLQRYLASLKDYEGVSGVITFDEDGSVRKPVFLKVVRHGQFILYKPTGGNEKQ